MVQLMASCYKVCGTESMFILYFCLDLRLAIGEAPRFWALAHALRAT